MFVVRFYYFNLLGKESTYLHDYGSFSKLPFLTDITKHNYKAIENELKSYVDDFKELICIRLVDDGGIFNENI